MIKSMNPEKSWTEFARVINHSKQTQAMIERRTSGQSINVMELAYLSVVKSGESFGAVLANNQLPYIQGAERIRQWDIIAICSNTRRRIWNIRQLIFQRGMKLFGQFMTEAFGQHKEQLPSPSIPGLGSHKNSGIEKDKKNEIQKPKEFKTKND